MSSNRLRKNLAADVRLGGITLFVGAGVSIGAGAPSWYKLAADVWREARPGKRPPPWLCLTETERRERDNARKALANAPGVGAAFRKSFELTPPDPHPLALQMVLEELEHHLRPKTRSAKNPVASGSEKLASLLRRHLYQDLVPGSSGSLATLAEILRADQKRADPRITRVITLNADDLLETAANEGHDWFEDPVVWPIARASFHPRRDACANDRPPICIYHLHGYLPREQNGLQREAIDTLVFTDAQYWESVASPISFANRVVATALHDSHCIFIGLSMTDVNLMRWLGLRFVELEADKLTQGRLQGRTERQSLAGLRRALRRHYWIRRNSADPSGFIGRHLLRRGVHSIEIEDWEADFRVLAAECFELP